MLVAAELHNPLQSICSLTSKLRTPLMSLTWQRTTVAETCNLKAERINKKLVSQSSVTKNSAARQHHLASSRNALFHLASSWTSKLRTQFVSLTLGMGIIVEHHDAVNYMHHTVLEGNIHKGTTNPTAW